MVNLIHIDYKIDHGLKKFIQFIIIIIFLFEKTILQYNNLHSQINRHVFSVRGSKMTSSPLLVE